MRGYGNLRGRFFTDMENDMTSVNAELFHREQDRRLALFDKETGEPTLNNPLRHLFEAVVWRHVSTELPNAEETVLIHVPTSDEPVWFGYYDGASLWFDVSGAVIRGESVKHWAPMLAGPGLR